MELFEKHREILRGGIRQFFAPQEAVAAGGAAETLEIRVERHPFCEFFFVLDGTSEYFLNGELLSVSPGTLCLIDGWIPHQYGFRPAGGACEQLWFSVHAGEIHYAFFRSLADGAFQTRSHGALPVEYAALFHPLAEARMSDGDSDRMRMFLNLVLLEVASGPQSPRRDSRRREPGVVAALKSCIRNRNGANCSLAELERILGYSRSHLSHRFRAATGIAVGEYINQVRLEYVERALRHGMKQKEIAAELGFASPAAFWLWRERRRREQSH